MDTGLTALSIATGVHRMNNQTLTICGIYRNFISSIHIVKTIQHCNEKTNITIDDNLHPYSI
jgi:hypothetical protein